MLNENSKAQRDKETILSILKYAMITAIVLFVLFLGFKLFSLLIPVIIGFVVAYTSSSFSSLIYRLFRKRHPRSAEEGGESKGYRVFKLINYTLFLLLFIGFIVFIVFALIAQVRNLLYFFNNNIPTDEIISNITTWLNGLSKNLGGILPESTISTLYEELIKIQNDILAAVPKVTASVLNSILSFIGNIPGLIFQAIVIIMSGYYFITDRIVISKFVREILPSEVFVSKVVTVVTKVSNSLFRVIGGYAFILTITFIESLIGLSIIRMPYVVIIALVVTAIDILPAVGASACFYPIAIYMFVQGRIFDGIIALVFVAGMTLVRTALEPKVIGTAMKLHPLATLIAMILGVSFLGIAGFLGGPILLICIIGIMDSFGFKKVTREWLGKILNKVATADAKTDLSCVPAKATVKHVVAWKLKDEACGQSKEANVRQIKEKLLTLPAIIPQLLSIEIGSDTKFDDTAYDCVLIATFANYEDLAIYKNHPAHKEVSQWVRQVIASRTVVDFDI